MLAKKTKVYFAKMITIVMIVAFSGVTFASTSNANVKESENTEVSTETVVETSSSTVYEETESSAFTPEGNMTIVDDIGNFSTPGKQFITVTTANGKYFYIVIDRDDHGEKSVHFLSLVDEEDLLDVLEPEVAKKYKDQIEESLSNASSPPLNLTQPETQPQETQPIVEIKENESSGKLSMFSTIIIILAMIGAGVFYWFTKKSNASSEDEAFDQDEEYDESDEEV